MNIGQNKRIHDFLIEGKPISEIADLTRGLLGIEYKNITKLIGSAKKEKVDAVILSAGAVKSHLDDLMSRNCPPFLIKADWSNYCLDDESPYPSQNFRQVLITSAYEALRLGASAVICDFFIGISDADNVKNIQMLRTLSGEGYKLGIPVIANIVPFGSRITDKNSLDAVLLAMRMSLELGATAAVVPLLKIKNYKRVLEANIDTPLMINAGQNMKREELESLKTVIHEKYPNVPFGLLYG